MRDDETIGVDERALDDEALELLAEAHAQPAPAALRTRILDAAGTQTHGIRLRRSLVRWRVVGSVAASAALVLAGLLAREQGRTTTQASALHALAEAHARLEAQAETQVRTLASLREALDANARLLQVLSGPRTVTARLAPKEGFAGAGRVVVDADSGEAHVVLAGLTPPAAGRVYELWAIRGDRPPEPAGLVTVGSGRAVTTRVSTIRAPEGVAAFAVSIEPAGGSPAPTGPIVLVGKVT